MPRRSRAKSPTRDRDASPGGRVPKKENKDPRKGRSPSPKRSLNDAKTAHLPALLVSPSDDTTYSETNDARDEIHISAFHAFYPPSPGDTRTLTPNEYLIRLSLDHPWPSPHAWKDGAIATRERAKVACKMSTYCDRLSRCKRAMQHILPFIRPNGATDMSELSNEFTTQALAIEAILGLVNTHTHAWICE